jgi:hypothetical protein
MVRRFALLVDMPGSIIIVEDCFLALSILEFVDPRAPKGDGLIISPLQQLFGRVDFDASHDPFRFPRRSSRAGIKT